MKTLMVVFLFLIIKMGMIAAQSMTWIRAIAWSPDGSQIAYATQDGSFQSIDISTGTVLIRYRELNGFVTALEWSPDSTKLVVGGTDRYVRVWDTVDGSIRVQLDTVSGNVRALDWHPSESLLIIVTQEGTPTNVHIWDINHQSVNWSLPVYDALTASWSPDGRSIAVGRYGRIEIWDIDNRVLVNSLSTTGWVVDLAWSPDTERIAGAVTYSGENAFVYVWDTQSATELYSYESHAGVINHISWNTESNLLISASQYGEVQILNVNPFEILETFNLGIRVYSAAWSPFGGQVAIGAPLSSGEAVMSRNADGGALPLSIIVPDPSPERLRAVARACDEASGGTLSLNPTTASLIDDLASESRQVTDALADDEQALDALIARLEAVPTDALPPGCRADLLAVARAIAAQAE